MLGLSISRVKPRQGRFTRVVPGMLVMLFYYLALLINHNALAEGQIPAWLGLWVTHSLFALFAGYRLLRFGAPVKA